jgi:hydroxymethylpyrimidine/phosphomethylpyrimidine kinase
MDPPVVMTIAGSDSGGAAGLQADLKAFAMHGVFGTSVITLVTAQNSAEIRDIHRLSGEFIEAQLAAVLDDLPVRAVKTGMLGSVETIAAVAKRAPGLPNLVVDPVVVDSAGRRLFGEEVERAYLEQLFPHATVITPNAREAGVLLGRTVSTVDEAIRAARDLAALGPERVVVKGGGLSGHVEAVDVVCKGGPDGEIDLLRSNWVETANNHGSGDAFGASVVARLARGEDIDAAITGAKAYARKALENSAGWRLGAGHGPLGWHVA